MEKYLVIVQGGLVGFAHATPALAAIRQRHRGARVVLLTDTDVETLAGDSPFADEVVSTEGWDEPRVMNRLAARLRKDKFHLIYDLAGSVAVERLIMAMKPAAPRYTGTLRGAAYPADFFAVSEMHPVDAALARIAPAGIQPLGPAIPDVSWAATARRNAPSLQPGYFGLREPYVVLAPGTEGMAGEPVWPAALFAGLAVQLVARGVGVAVACEPADRDAARAVVRACSEVRDLAARANHTQMCAIAVHANGSFGQAQTGLMHVLAAAGAPTVAVTRSHDEANTAPRGRAVVALTATTPESLTVEYAADAIGMFARLDVLRASA